MIENLSEKIRNIGLGMMEEEETGHRKLGEFLVSLSDNENVREPKGYALSLFNCLIEASDRLNDTVVPLFSMFVENEYNVEDFKSVILLFDENIDLDACKELIFEATSENVSYEDFDEILKVSSDQKEFERLLREKIKEITALESEQNNESEKTVLADTESMEIGKDFISYLKAENERLTKQIDDLKLKRQVSLEKEKEESERLYRINTDITNKEAEIESLKSELSKVKLSVVLFENKYEKAQEMFDQERKINAKLSTFSSSELPELKKLQAENDELKASISKIDEENVRLLSLNESLKAENDRLLRENSLLKEENQTLNDEVDGLRNRDVTGQRIMPTINVDDIPSKVDDMSYPFIGDNNDELPGMKQDIPFFSSGFTADLFNDDEPEDYTESDVIVVESKKESVLKSCNIFSKFLSRHFEKKFAKKSQAEQNNLIFMKLMEGNYSKDILKTVRSAIESNDSVSRVDLYKVISAKGDKNEILRLCNAA